MYDPELVGTLLPMMHFIIGLQHLQQNLAYFLFAL